MSNQHPNEQLEDMAQARGDYEPRECLEDGSDCGSTLCPKLVLTDEEVRKMTACEFLRQLGVFK